jgi:hypothetical protein
MPSEKYSRNELHDCYRLPGDGMLARALKDLKQSWCSFHLARLQETAKANELSPMQQGSRGAFMKLIGDRVVGGPAFVLHSSVERARL